MQVIPDMDNQQKPSMDYLINLESMNYNIYPLKESFAKTKIFYDYEPHEYIEPERLFNNPISKTSFVLQRGKALYQRYCVPCHNFNGKGNGPIITQVVLNEDEEGFPPPKDLTSEATKKMTDGRIFHILSAGQNLMFSFHDKLNELDKWLIIHYLRELQNEK